MDYIYDITNNCNINTTNFFNLVNQKFINDNKVQFSQQYDLSYQMMLVFTPIFTNNTRDWSVEPHTGFIGLCGEENYSLDGNFGISAFPGRTSFNQKFVTLKDFNANDKYRFLYLWRTYQFKGYDPYNIFYDFSYKLRLY